MSNESRKNSKVESTDSTLSLPQVSVSRSEKKRILSIDYDSDEFENDHSSSEWKKLKVDVDGSPGYQQTTPSTYSSNSIPVHSIEYLSEPKNRSSTSIESIITNPAPSCLSSSTSQFVTEETVKKIFIWDLDETIIIFHSLLTGSFADKYSKVNEKAVELGCRMEEFIFSLADTFLFFNEIEDCDQVHIDDLVDVDDGRDLMTYDFAGDGFQQATKNSQLLVSKDSDDSITEKNLESDWIIKLAFRYRKVKGIFYNNKSSVEDLLGTKRGKEWIQLRTEIESMTDNWLQLALKSLSLIKCKVGYVNILVTTTQLIPAIAKVLLFGLGDIFDIEDVYSATKVGKEACFKRIVSKFGSKCTYIVIGDGQEEERAAKQMEFPFWRITCHDDLAALFNALDIGFI